ncbi:MAG: hypothetical protein EOM20_11715 [Spartobacteria bacterium]|nr:hypothetical protein [Spartobacteria bacterium]
MKKRLYIAMISILAVSSVFVFAQPRGAHAGRGGEGRGKGAGIAVKWILACPEVAKKAGVTDEDISALTALDYEHQKVMIPMQAQRRLAQLELDHLLDQDAPDKTAVGKAVEDLGAIDTSLKKAKIDYLLQVKDALGPEKIEKLREARRNFARKHRNQDDGPRGKGNRKGGKDGRGSKGRGQGGGGPEMSGFDPEFEDEYMEDDIPVFQTFEG